MDGVDLAARPEVPQAQQRRDRQEGLDPRRALAHDAAGLEAVHPARELPADQGHGQQEAGLDEVPRPLDAPAARPERGALQDVGGRNGIQPDEGVALLQGLAGEPGERDETHRNESTVRPRGAA